MTTFNWLLNTIAISAVLGSSIEYFPSGMNNTLAENESSAAPYIVGGQQARPFQYPFMVFITDQQQQCGGSIIGRNLVVTAAHCISTQDPSPYIVVAHRHNLQSPESSEQAVRFQVRQVIVHPAWNRQSLDNDIALLVLNNDNPNAIPGSNMDNMLQLNSQTPGDGATTKLIGWGRTQGGGNTSPVLKETDLRVVDGNQCAQMFGPFNPSTKVCVAPLRQGDSACQGDSGGPLVSGNSLVGVVSHGTEYCDGPASVYTNVANYVSWINQYRNGGSGEPSNPEQPEQPQQPEQPEQNWWDQQPQQPEQNWWDQQPQQPEQPEQNWWDQQPQQPEQNWWDQQPQQPEQPEQSWWDQQQQQSWWSGWF